MKRIIEYQCDGNVPTSGEIEEALRVAVAENAIVKLNWYFPFSGGYSVLVYPEDTFTDVENRLPRTYGV